MTCIFSSIIRLSVCRKCQDTQQFSIVLIWAMYTMPYLKNKKKLWTKKTFGQKKIDLDLKKMCSFAEILGHVFMSLQCEEEKWTKLQNKNKKVIDQNKRLLSVNREMQIYNQMLQKKNEDLQVLLQSQDDIVAVQEHIIKTLEARLNINQ